MTDRLDDESDIRTVFDNSLILKELLEPSGGISKEMAGAMYNLVVEIHGAAESLKDRFYREFDGKAA